MIALLELIALLLVLMLIAQFIFGLGFFANRSRTIEHEARAPLPGATPAQEAAEALKGLAVAQTALNSRYPAVYGMLSGYLNTHSIDAAGGIENAVRQMLVDHASRRDQIKGELVRLLAENVSEEEIRAVVLSACDATFEQEGYRNWLIWLLGRFNAM